MGDKRKVRTKHNKHRPKKVKDKGPEHHILWSKVKPNTPVHHD